LEQATAEAEERRQRAVEAAEEAQRQLQQVSSAKAVRESELKEVTERAARVSQSAERSQQELAAVEGRLTAFRQARELDARDDELRRREEAATRSGQAALDKRAEELDKLEAALSERERTLESRETQLQPYFGGDGRVAVAQRSEEIERREAAVAGREQVLEQREARFRADQRRQLERREGEAEARAAAEAKETEVAVLQRNVEGLEKSRAELKAQKRVLDAREQAFGQHVLAYSRALRQMGLQSEAERIEGWQVAPVSGELLQRLSASELTLLERSDSQAVTPAAAIPVSPPIGADGVGVADSSETPKKVQRSGIVLFDSDDSESEGMDAEMRAMLKECVRQGEARIRQWRGSPSSAVARQRVSGLSSRSSSVDQGPGNEAVQ